jgi:hypothetical protein
MVVMTINLKENNMEKNESGTQYQELVMVFSPILGVTYELQNVITEDEWDEEHALDLVLNKILE